jgi:flagellar basal-body rod modification protein FlgD
MTIDPTSLAASTGLLGVDSLTGGSRPAGVTTLKRGQESSDVFGLGRDDFFKLFLAQLKNQDPTQPFDDKEFLAQLAQFSMIDTLNEVRRVMSGGQLSQAATMIGQQVEGWAEDGTAVAGTVDRIVQDEKGILLVVNGWGVRPESVRQVTPGASAPTEAGSPAASTTP